MGIDPAPEARRDEVVGDSTIDPDAPPPSDQDGLGSTAPDPYVAGESGVPPLAGGDDFLSDIDCASVWPLSIGGTHTIDPNAPPLPDTTGTESTAPDPDATTEQGVPSTVTLPESGYDEDCATVLVPGPRPLRSGAVAPSECLIAEQRFRVLRPLARGGLGEVMLARDEVFGREVALKHIRGHLGGNRDMKDRFLVEAKLTGNLEHPGIVGVYAIGEDRSGQPFYAMKLIRGESLGEAIRRYHEGDRSKRSDGERALSFRKLINRLVDVCNAVGFAHSRGVLHRDIKPANVMIGKYGETLVVDWGLAKRLYKGVPGDAPSGLPAVFDPDDASGLASSGLVVGTPAYMSPEQAQGRQDLMEPTSDVYSLGATLYCILTGRTPITGRNMSEVIEAARAGRFPPPREVSPAVEPALEAICLKAMAHEPEDRYATARALADDLERWLADEPVVAYREPPGRALSRWLARHPDTLIRVLVAAAGLLAVALFALVAAIFWRG